MERKWFYGDFLEAREFAELGRMEAEIIDENGETRFPKMNAADEVDQLSNVGMPNVL